MSISSFSRPLASLLVLVALLAGLADGTAHARRHSKKARLQQLVKEAEALFVDGKYEEALGRYRDAYAIKELDGLVYMQARCLEQLDRYEEALEHYERFMAASEDPDARTKAQVAARELREKLKTGKLILQVSPFGAEVSVDGLRVGKAPVDPLEVPPGRHEVVAKLPAYTTGRQFVDVEGAREATVAIALEKSREIGTVTWSVQPEGAEILLDGETVGTAPREPLVTKAGPHEVTLQLPGYLPQQRALVVVGGESVTVEAELRLRPPPDRITPLLSWVGLGLGVAAAGGGTIAFLLGEKDHAEVADAGGGSPDEPAALSQREAAELIEDGDAKKLAGYVLWGVGGAALVASALLFTTVDAPRRDDDEGAVTVESVSLSPCPQGFCLGALARF